MNPVQHFTDEYLQRCKALSPGEIARFLDDFRKVHGRPRAASKLISMKVPEDLLSAFKTRSRLNGVPYQAQIKKLMVEWLEQQRTGDG